MCAFTCVFVCVHACMYDFVDINSLPLQDRHPFNSSRAPDDDFPRFRDWWRYFVTTFWTRSLYFEPPRDAGSVKVVRAWQHHHLVLVLVGKLTHLTGESLLLNVICVDPCLHRFLPTRQVTALNLQSGNARHGGRGRACLFVVGSLIEAIGVTASCFRYVVRAQHAALAASCLLLQQIRSISLCFSKRKRSRRAGKYVEWHTRKLMEGFDNSVRTLL